MKELIIECRNCNLYFFIDKKNMKYRCLECGYEEEFKILDKEGDKLENNKKHNSS